MPAQAATNVVKFPVPRKPKVDGKHDREPKLVFHKASGVWLMLYHRSDAATKRSSLSSKFGRKEEGKAREWMKGERDRLGAVARNHEVNPTVAQGRVTISQCLDKVLEYYKGTPLDDPTPPKKPTSYKTQRSHVEAHLRPDLGSLRADAFTLADLERARTKWSKAGAADGSINRYVHCLKMAFKRGRAHGLIARMPDIEWPWNEEIERDEIIEDQELAQVNAAEPWHAQRLLNIFAGYIGMRSGELRKLRWNKNVVIATHTILLNANEAEN